MNRRVLLLLLVAGCGNTAFPADDAADDVPMPDAGAPDDPDATPPDAVVPAVDRAIDGQITINEVMASNAYTVKDEHGSPGDWIELYNPTDTDLALHGYGLTDDLTDPGAWVFGPDVMLRAHDHLVVWLDDASGTGPLHASFKLSKDGGELALSRPDGSWIDRVTYLDQETDFSAAREPDGSDLWKLTWHPTPGAANHTGTGAPMPLEDDAAPPEALPPAGDLSATIYAYDAIPEYQLVVSPEAAAALEAEPRVYQPAQLVIDGRMYGPIGIRCKGQNSFQPFSQKPSLRLSIDEYQPDARVFGLKDMTLNNMDNDYSMMHERIAYMFARTVGVPASRASHARLFVNGAFYGLYTSVETVKKKMIGRWFEDNEGPLFEATDVDFKSQYVPLYALENGPDDRSLLTGAASALAQSDPDAAIASAAAFIDLEAFQLFWAMCSVVGQFDSFPYSIPGDDYFLYADPTTHKLRPLPWGIDEAFMSADFPANQVSSVLATQCMASPSCYDGYVQKTWELQAQAESMNLLGEVDRIKNQIAASVAQDTRKPYTAQEVTTYQNGIKYFLTTRRTRLGTWLPPQH